MLKYHDLTLVEQEMVDAEIKSNYNRSARINSEYQRIKNNVHEGISCCNCFRLEKNCCCDTEKGCIEDDDEYTEDL